MSAPRPVRQLDRGALLGLAHPLRVQLFDALVSQGPATASELGRRLGESSGATSYHLRQLERHGFVETDPDRGTGRERWWRAVNSSIRSRGGDFEEDPSASEAYRVLSAEWRRSRQGRYDAWVASKSDWPEAWRDAVGDFTSHLWLDLEETAELHDELLALLGRWAERQDGRVGEPGYRSIELAAQLFPVGRAPEDDAD